MTIWRALPSSAGVGAYAWAVLHLHWWLRILVLVSTMLQRLTGWSVVRVGWIGAIPFVAGLIGMLLLGCELRSHAERRWHFAIPQLIAALALGGVVFSSAFQRGSRRNLYAAWFWDGRISAIFLGIAFHISHQFGSSGRCVGFINCTASIGGFFGPKMIGNLSQRTGSFSTGFIFMIACFIIASVLVLLCPRENVGGPSAPRPT